MVAVPIELKGEGRAAEDFAPAVVRNLSIGVVDFRRAPANTIVHGFDISPTLIEVARARTLPDERSIAFKVANIAMAPAPEEPYDRLASRFGVMFFDDPQAAFANL
jgi:ubiquinone/menaquinone biosynthesis C-methylase UbiE